MGVGFGRRDDAFAQGVATVTGSWSTSENTADVAGFAGCCGMSAIEGETGGHVVEVASTLLRLRFGHSLK
jgi:hypothetical protein